VDLRDGDPVKAARIVLGLLIVAGSQVLNIQAAAKDEWLLAAFGIVGTLYGLYVIATAGRE
jgi:hypothetical protein